MNEAAQSGSAASRAARIAVIGGGISGLAAAHRLLSLAPHTHVTLFESSLRLGGIIRTEEADGFLMELGPDSFITNKPAAITLCEELRFLPQLISTDSRYRRSLVLSKGRPLPVPDGFMLMAPEKPLALLTSPVLSISGRLRLLAEYFIPPQKITTDESLASFVRRRFGHEALDRLVQPLVGGIYTSDPERLSLKATLPRFLEMEASHGSVILRLPRPTPLLTKKQSRPQRSLRQRCSLRPLRRARTRTRRPRRHSRTIPPQLPLNAVPPRNSDS